MVNFEIKKKINSYLTPHFLDYPEYLDQNGKPIERTVYTMDFYLTPPCFWTIINSDNNKGFTFNNLDNDINDYYQAVSVMT